MMARQRRRGYCRTGRESRVVSRRRDDGYDDGVTSMSGLSGSLSLCLASLSLCLTCHHLFVSFLLLFFLPQFLFHFLRQVYCGVFFFFNNFLFTWVMGSCLLSQPAGLGIHEGGPSFFVFFFEKFKLLFFFFFFFWARGVRTPLGPHLGLSLTYMTKFIFRKVYGEILVEHV